MGRHRRVQAATSSPAPPVDTDVTVYPRRMRLGSGWATTLIVTGYPSEVGPAWIEPLLDYPGRLDVSIHIDPVPPAHAAARLRRQMAKHESTTRSQAQSGKLEDFHAEAAADDAREMAAALARGDTRIHRVALALTVHAASEEALTDAVDHVTSLASSMLLDTHPATYRQLDGWLSSLPLGVDRLSHRRAMDTAALSASFPFASSDIGADTSPGAIFLGHNATSAAAGVVAWNRWSLDSYNSVIIARSGSGKSYLCKLELLRSLYAGVTAAVIDPEREYDRLTQAVDGSLIPLGRPGAHVNPLDLDPDAANGAGDPLTSRALFVQTLVEVMLGAALVPRQRAALDAAIAGTYARAGITADAATWHRPAPLLADLTTTLHASTDEHARDLALQLAPYATGSHSRLFAGPTTSPPRSHLVTWSLRDLPDELRGVGTLIALDAIWRHVAEATPDHPRLIVVDEAWLLLQSPAGAQWLSKIAKAGRKRWVGLTLATQDAQDVLSSDLGRAVVQNASTQILMRQSPQAIGDVAATFGLSDGEKQWLLTASPGQALLLHGQDTRVAIEVTASDTEHQLVTTNPAEG